MFITVCIITYMHCMATLVCMCVMSLLMLLIRAVDFYSKRDHKQTDSNGLMDYDLVECTELYFYTAAYVELEYQWCSNTYFYSCFFIVTTTTDAHTQDSYIQHCFLL